MILCNKLLSLIAINLTCWSLREMLLLLFSYQVFCWFCKLRVDFSEMTQGVQLVRMKVLNIYGNKVSHIYFVIFSCNEALLDDV